MKSITYRDQEERIAVRPLFSVRRKTATLLRKSLIPGATTLRVLADGSKGCRTL